MAIRSATPHSAIEEDGHREIRACCYGHEMLQVLWHIALAVSVTSETMQLSIGGNGASVEVPGCNQLDIRQR